MGLSRNPAARRRQLANLKQGSDHGLGGRPVEHGARARITVAELEPKVAAVFAALSEDVPVREANQLPNADAPAAKMLAEMLVRLDRISDFLDRRGWQDDKGNPRSVLDYETRLRGQALDLMRELGLTPASRLKLGLDLTRARAMHSSLDDFVGSTTEDADR